MTVYGYHCWLMECSQTIPDGEEVWQDGDGVDLPKKWKGIPKAPAPYHPLCAEKRRAALSAPSPSAEAPALGPPAALPEGVNLEAPGPSSVGGDPAPAAPAADPKGQMRLF